MEGPEGVKWELGFACFCTGKMGFRSLGLGFESEKKPKWEWDWCFVSISVGSGHWLVGYGKKWWLGNEIGNPPSGPCTCNLKLERFTENHWFKLHMLLHPITFCLNYNIFSKTRSSIVVNLPHRTRFWLQGN